jgi:hypothetical protein
MTDHEFFFGLCGAVLGVLIVAAAMVTARLSGIVNALEKLYCRLGTLEAAVRDRRQA